MPEAFTYKGAGVDIDAMNRALESIKESVHRTFTPAVLSQLGSFGGMMALDVSGYRQPVLVASIDGVGHEGARRADDEPVPRAGGTTWWRTG
jgi:phosphoribosylformylglycinamidine cyclo-ligase